ncbi:hypothetical protein ASPCADRAFT_134009 [Aspergillus carbonarius ITEM 5010]|uniref:Uncharacterized protein n=1 Tax=Aspergillus carbonarius (strain ITEM 5010) TaxID=602072 RepID=A0A1R3RBX6_ASPC5|nr:hypothetical protein ASPCADRAFT_134009 [Aspergillus carbonarius ITEM 5010]
MSGNLTSDAVAYAESGCSYPHTPSLDTAETMTPRASYHTYTHASPYSMLKHVNHFNEATPVQNGLNILSSGLQRPYWDLGPMHTGMNASRSAVDTDPAPGINPLQSAYPRIGTITTVATRPILRRSFIHAGG